MCVCVYAFQRPQAWEELKPDAAQNFDAAKSGAAMEEQLSTVRQQRFCAPVDLHRIDFVRASRNTPQTVFFDCLQGGTVDERRGAAKISGGEHSS